MLSLAESSADWCVMSAMPNLSAAPLSFFLRSSLLTNMASVMRVLRTSLTSRRSASLAWPSFSIFSSVAVMVEV